MATWAGVNVLPASVSCPALARRFVIPAARLPARVATFPFPFPLFAILIHLLSEGANRDPFPGGSISLPSDG